MGLEQKFIITQAQMNTPDLILTVQAKLTEYYILDTATVSPQELQILATIVLILHYF